MIRGSADEFAAELENVIRRVPGVTEVFRTGGLVSLAKEGAARLVGTRGEAALVRVEQRSDGIRVDVALGVDNEVGAVDAVHNVHAAINALCADRSAPVAAVRVTVVHIDEVG